MFTALVQAKRAQFIEDAEEPDADGWEDAESACWTDLLDEEARAHFSRAFDYSSDEGKTYRALWELTDWRRRSDPIFNLPGPWNFESVIGSILSAEYLLLELELEPAQTGDAHGVLRYDPLAGPFGGTESLVQLVEGFGQRVVHDSWHDGPHHRPVVGWDLERAKRLVAAGRGVE